MVSLCSNQKGYKDNDPLRLVSLWFGVDAWCLSGLTLHYPLSLSCLAERPWGTQELGWSNWVIWFNLTIIGGHVFLIPVSSESRQVHVEFLTQVSGPILDGKQLCHSLAERDGVLFHESGKHPDRWCLKWKNPPYEPLINSLTFIKGPSRVCSLSSIHYSKEESQAARICHTTSLLQFRNSKTLVMYTLFKCSRLSYVQMKWQPLPL